MISPSSLVRDPLGWSSGAGDLVATVFRSVRFGRSEDRLGLGDHVFARTRRHILNRSLAPAPGSLGACGKLPVPLHHIWSEPRSQHIHLPVPLSFRRPYRACHMMQKRLRYR
jgi:hypothetical protein